MCHADRLESRRKQNAGERGKRGGGKDVCENSRRLQYGGGRGDGATRTHIRTHTHTHIEGGRAPILYEFFE